MALRSSLPRARSSPERPPSDADLEAARANIAFAADGDAGAFDALYDRYQAEVSRYFGARVSQPELAQELTQQLFLRAWQAIPRYRDSGLPFTAWLLRMAHGLARDHVRAQRKTSLAVGHEIPAKPGGAVDRRTAGERSAPVQRALERLSEDHRQVLILRFVLEQPAREIAQVMGCSEANVRSHQLRALESLRAALEAEGDR